MSHPPVGMLVHLSTNLWNDSPTPIIPRWGPEEPFFSPDLRFDDKLWHDFSEGLAEAGAGFVVLDLGDGVQYESCPEIAVRGAWSTSRLREELDRLRSLGLEPLPKLNFSASHDAWMGDFARKVSTPEYYQFCEALIAEVGQLFDTPRLFHIGMDEETYSHQRTYPYVVVRQADLWWHDLEFYIDRVERTGARAWMWSDYAWHHPDFFTKVSPKVLQSNWHYGPNFSGGPEQNRPAPIDFDVAAPATYLTYLDLADAGLDHIPTGSTWEAESNFVDTVRFALERLPQDQVLGYLQTDWKNMIAKFADVHARSLTTIRQAVQVLRG